MSTTAAGIDRLLEGIGELQAVHASRKGLADYSLYENDPVGFLRDVLKVPHIWSKQVAVAEAVRDHAQVVVVGANAAGKDHLAARLALWWVYARRGFVSVTGPTERQVKQVCFGEIARAFAAAPELPGKLFELALKIDGAEHTGIAGYTASDSSRATGVHAPRLLVIATEAQGMEPWAFEAIFANATGDDSHILAIGNPLHVGGKFAEFAASPHWHCVTMPATEHPNVVTGQNVIPGAVTRAGVERIANEYGVNSTIYRSRVLAMFPTEAAECLVPREWMARAAELHRTHQWRHSGTAVIAVDVARLGPDKTVVAIREGKRLAHLLTLPKSDTMETADAVLAAVESRGYRVRHAEPTSDDFGMWRGVLPGPLDLIRVDEVGLGAGVLDRLRQLKANVEGFNGARSPVHGATVVHNARAEAFWGLRTLLERGELGIPEDEEVAQELAAAEWFPNKATGLIQILGKDELKAVLGRSPDKSDAVSMAFYKLWVPMGDRVTFTPVRVAC
ncbi:MAG: hypothetical protein SFU57_00185 [Gemmatimonadales bacterium]|nr:hypothetical protein [Gemmatimonadales bacterium]